MRVLLLPAALLLSFLACTDDGGDGGGSGGSAASGGSGGTGGSGFDESLCDLAHCIWAQGQVCTEQNGPDVTEQAIRDNCEDPKMGTYGAGLCPREGRIGGCVPVNNVLPGYCYVEWYYDASLEEDLRATCDRVDGVWLEP